MINKLSILIPLALVSCSQPAEQNKLAKMPLEAVTSIIGTTVNADALPSGFSVVEEQPNGYFIRLSSPERATLPEISTIADTLIGKFDRVDLCLNVAHERGDEYISIIGGQVFDYENDVIYSLDNTISNLKSDGFDVVEVEDCWNISEPCQGRL